MKRFLSTALICVVSFALGVAFQRYYDSRRAPAQPLPSEISTTKPEPPKPAIPFDREPLWAYGFDTVAKADDKAPAQASPTRNLRPNEDPAEQTRKRRARGSDASYSLVDVRDGHDVIDWFPRDHPSPMPPIIRNGPAAGTGNTGRGCVRVIFPRQRTPRECAAGRAAGRVLHAAASGLQERLRRSADPRKPTRTR